MEQEFRYWQCQSCGEIYSEEDGSPESNIAPGTRFEDLPDDWICPACGSGKSEFVLVE